MSDLVSPIQMIIDERLSGGFGGRWYGVYPALVTDITDPDAQGRVKITLPWSPDTGSAQYETWARMAMFMAGNNRGTWFIPDADDEVLVAFEGGDPRRPYVLGMLWNGSDSPHESMASGNNIKSIRSRNGVKLTLDDTDGSEQFIVETPGGQTITLKDGAGSVEIKDSNGNSVKFEASGMTFNSSGAFSVTASSISLSAGTMSVDTGTNSFSGPILANAMVQTPTIIAQTYTPGAGNMW
jgi:uncharacterized protein involved in type VI secretion and phage assembly